MKKIGREVLFLKTSDINPRNGEGGFIRLNDGRIMFAYTEYYGSSKEEWYDHATARISACYSSDEGETWTLPEILFEKEDTEKNIMSVSFIRMANGELGVLYLAKIISGSGSHLCMPIFRYSSDDGKTWSERISCADLDGYYIVNNDRVVRLESGRLIFPAAYTGSSFKADEENPVFGTLDCAGKIKFFYSDDNGRTWDTLDCVIKSPFDDDTGLQEPGIYEYESGRLWAWFRTAYGHQYQSFSDDGGISWTKPAPNFHFTSPDSPMQVKKVGRYTLAIFNPLGYSCVNEHFEYWKSPKRTPFVCAVSENDGISFDSTGKTSRDGGFEDFTQNCFLFEDDYSESYCYPAVIETADGFMVAYYHSNGTGVSLNSTKIIKIRFDELNSKF